MKMSVVAGLVVLLWTWAHSHQVFTADHSIMEMINTKHVLHILSSASPIPNNHTNTKPSTIPRQNHRTDGEFTDVHDNSVSKKVRKGQRSSIPDITTVFMDLSRPDKVLKTTDNGMLVTKKAYVRKDWCKTEPIIQKIREDGCQPKNIVNRFCYGQCNSFYIPKNIVIKKERKRKRTEENDEEVSFRSCGVCKPKKQVWVQVTLNCPGLDPPLRRRGINKVKQCQCMAQNVYR